MSKLPTQLTWERFVSALKELGCRQVGNKSGSARSFLRADGEPVTFHQPHGSDTIRQGTLTEYIRKLGTTREQFMAALDGPSKTLETDEGEVFRRTTLPNGNLVSNCNRCFAVVAENVSPDAADELETAHVCETI